MPHRVLTIYLPSQQTTLSPCVLGLWLDSLAILLAPEGRDCVMRFFWMHHNSLTHIAEPPKLTSLKLLPQEWITESSTWTFKFHREVIFDHISLGIFFDPDHISSDLIFESSTASVSNHFSKFAVSWGPSGLNAQIPPSPHWIRWVFFW